MNDRVFIALGSNLGDRAGNLRKAAALIERQTRVISVSPFYETEPWGDTGQGPFINAVIEVRTQLGPAELLSSLKSIEEEMGRKPERRWGPRLIDLDIIFYGDKIIEKEGLKIPHPGAHERAFVLVPLNDIAPEFIHPSLGKTISVLAGGIGSKGVKRIDP